MSTTPTIHTIDVPRPKYPFIPDVIPTDEPVSVHVLDGEETVLFGTGYAAGAAELVRGLEPFGGPDLVVVEHADPDHYDCVPLLRELYDGLEVAVADAAAAALADAGIEAEIRIDHDDVVGGTRAIHLPGHTPGNTSFLHEDTGTLFVGDTFVHASSPNAAPGDWSGPFAEMNPELSWDPERGRESVGRLREYDVRSARVTHGPNVDDAAAGIETLVEDLEQA